MTPALSQLCTLNAAFDEDVREYAGAGATAIEVWLTKLERFLESHSVADVQSLLNDHSLRVVAAAGQGGLLLSQGEARRSAYDHFKRRLDLCQQLRIPVIVVVADLGGIANETDLNRSMVSIAETARWAAGYSVRVALEFQARNAFLNNLGTALDVLEQLNEPNLGLGLDAFHFMQGPSKESDLLRLTVANLFHVQLCDIAGVPRELMSDSDRVLPGDGDFDLKPLLERLKAIGYTGAVSVETMNPLFWKSKPSQVAELALAALKRIL